MSGTGARGARTGPLTGIEVVEFGGIEPARSCAMLQADLGADEIREPIHIVKGLRASGAPDTRAAGESQ
ncbi:hypothetical protein BH09ACT6_BH09ACT6_06530 [soil metagenome]